MIWFTSDTHFNHQNILKGRPQFSSVEEMNEAIIERWNAKVARGDRVYHLGDVALGRPEAAAEVLKRLKGQIHLVKGNHDRVAQHRLCRDRFASIRSLDSITVDGQHIVMCHYAMRTWDRRHYGSWQLFGHSHGAMTDVEGMKQFDVGVDSWDFTPISLDTVRERIASLPQNF